MTRSGEDTNAEEEAIANIFWLVNIHNIDNDSDAVVSFQSGVHFNFAESISAKKIQYG